MKIKKAKRVYVRRKPFVHWRHRKPSMAEPIIQTSSTPVETIEAYQSKIVTWVSTPVRSGAFLIGFVVGYTVQGFKQGFNNAR